MLLDEQAVAIFSCAHYFKFVPGADEVLLARARSTTCTASEVTQAVLRKKSRRPPVENCGALHKATTSCILREARGVTSRPAPLPSLCTVQISLTSSPEPLLIFCSGAARTNATVFPSGESAGSLSRPDVLSCFVSPHGVVTTMFPSIAATVWARASGTDDTLKAQSSAIRAGSAERAFDTNASPICSRLERGNSFGRRGHGCCWRTCRQTAVLLDQAAHCVGSLCAF